MTTSENFSRLIMRCNYENHKVQVNYPVTFGPNVPVGMELEAPGTRAGEAGYGTVLFSEYAAIQ